jgi:hypothetical protein
MKCGKEQIKTRVNDPNVEEGWYEPPHTTQPSTGKLP